MNNISPNCPIPQSWHWCTPEGSREFDRLTDRMLTLRDKIQWLEEAENLSLVFQKSREKRSTSPPPPVTDSSAPSSEPQTPS